MFFTSKCAILIHVLFIAYTILLCIEFKLFMIYMVANEAITEQPYNNLCMGFNFVLILSFYFEKGKNDYFK